ncbi:MAG: serine/threonine protein kinase [Kiritimatiellaeota bacterium]|nr:serine/threonine protein kinase [Kiritimatiellota bacterium]
MPPQAGDHTVVGFLHRSARKRETGQLPGRESLLRAFEKGGLPCSKCGQILPLDQLGPLRVAKCGKCGTPNFTPMKVGRFWLFYPAGGGGMGSVYQAYHTDVPGRIFAVKLLARSERNNPARIHALILEVETARKLGVHPCLVSYAGGGYSDGEYYFAMEFVKGRRLDELFDLQGHLPEKAVLLICLYILAAEQHIYDRGFLYRDLKPENVLITPEGRAVLLDYGLCQPREQALHPTDEFVTGSPYYLPPERLWGTGEDAYSEIYSLGMVLYYALTGRTFFDADEVEALAKKHVSAMRLSVESRLKGFRPELVRVLARMIRRDPAERYRTFSEVAGDVFALYRRIVREEQAPEAADAVGK